MNRRRKIVVTTLALLISAYGYSDKVMGESTIDSQSTGVTADEIVLGSCAATSGQMAERGSSVVAGGKAYFDYVNEHGGINGRKIRLVSCNDLYSPDAADKCFDSCLKDKVFAGVLFQGTPTAARYVPKAEQDKMPVVGFSTGARFIINPVHRYVFQIRPSFDDEAKAQVDTLYKKFGLHKIALVYQNDAYGTACREGILNALKEYHVQPVTEVTYNRLDVNVDPVIAQVAKSAPEAVIVGGAGSALPRMMMKREAFGKSVQMVAFSSGTDLIAKEAGAQADGVLITQVLPFLDTSLPSVRLYRELIEKYEHKAANDSGFEGFLIAMVVTEGLKRADKNLTREKFVKALESMHGWDIGLGALKVKLSATRHDALPGAVHWTVMKNGKPELVQNLSALTPKARP